MKFQLGQRIKGQMVCLSIHPDCWIEIERRLYASKVQNKLYNPSFYQSIKTKVFWLLSGLGPEYESFATAMLKPPVPSYADLIPLLQSHELRSKGHQSDLTN